ncbi:MAG: hypothetical protein WBC33_05545 [Conexibacter sp.]
MGRYSVGLATVRRSPRGGDYAGEMVSTRPGLETPRELFERLERNTQARGGWRYTLEQRHVDRSLHALGVAPDERGEPLASARATMSELAALHLRELAEHMPEEMRRFVLDERRLVAGALNAPDVNAHALRAANGGWLIVVSQGLVGFVFKVIRALGRHVLFTEDGPEQIPEVQETAALIASSFDWYLVTGAPLGPDFPIGPAQLRLASDVSAYSQRFVVAHELAHHLLDHVAAGTRSMRVGGTHVDAMAVTKAQELEADALGLQMLLASTLTRGPDLPPTIRAYAGAELLFHTTGLLEAYAKAPASDTHPPASERLAGIRSRIERMTEHHATVRAFAVQIDRLVAAVRPHVLSAERRATALAAQPDCDARVRGLVERHAGAGEEGFRAFHAAVVQIADRFCAEVICRAFGGELRRAVLDLGTAAAGAERADAQGRTILLARFLDATEAWRPAVVARAGLAV